MDLKEYYKKERVNAEIEVVSGMTNEGIPQVSYKVARKLGFKCTGIACERAKELDCFECDNIIFEGKEWGDESSAFLQYVDVLVKVGGGKQSEKEFRIFKKGPKYELPLSSR